MGSVPKGTEYLLPLPVKVPLTMRLHLVRTGRCPIHKNYGLSQVDGYSKAVGGMYDGGEVTKVACNYPGCLISGATTGPNDPVELDIEFRYLIRKP